MDLQSNLIESKKQSQKGGWQASMTSLILHGVLITTIAFVGLHATHKVDAEDKPISAFIRALLLRHRPLLLPRLPRPVPSRR